MRPSVFPPCSVSARASSWPVSYTHLDVYKRQQPPLAVGGRRGSHLEVGGGHRHASPGGAADIPLHNQERLVQEEGDTCMVNLGGATENDREKIVITKDSKAFFHNNVDYCGEPEEWGLH